MPFKQKGKNGKNNAIDSCCSYSGVSRIKKLRFAALAANGVAAFVDWALDCAFLFMD
jgi:hypothetical protein